VLQRTIPSEYWWYLVLYVRQISTDSEAGH
jgi:hypothetical protein